ncbi:MAG: hypothetical protein ACOY3E_00040 [Pseudomonadota bacterium]
MRQPVCKFPESEIKKSYPLSGLVDGWYFKLNEQSAGVYTVEGSDLWGRKVSHTGTNEKELFSMAIKSAQAIKNANT